jgi:hypothetical protein
LKGEMDHAASLQLCMKTAICQQHQKIQKGQFNC